MPATFEPAYLPLLRSGKLEERVSLAYERLTSCDCCAWGCKVNRRAGVLGICRTGEKARLASYVAHYGEEAILSGWSGSGTIFFARCNLRCQYCQNFQISQADAGDLVEPQELAAIMLELQAIGCHNINFVSPSHVTPQILAAVCIAARSGLRLPLVYNSGGYDSLSMLELLDGVIDIYMPDMKYANAQIARHYSKILRYPEINRAVVREMHRQVGDLQITPQGLARRGLLVRHLVLPNNLAGTAEIIRFLVEQVSPNTYLNLMDQYHPNWLVDAYPNHYPKLNRRITSKEHESAVQLAHQAGLTRLA